MKRFFYAALSVLMVAFLSGCIQDSIVIHIKPDGSGTIEETALFSNSVLDIMDSFAVGMADAGKQKGDQDNKDAARGDSEKELKKMRAEIIAKMVKDAEKRAESFGAAVKFVSAKPAKTDTASGYTAVYAFQDINQVKVNQNPGDKVEGQKAGKSDSLPKEEFLLFKFIKGSPARLIVTLPAQKDTAGEKQAAPDSAEAGEGKPDMQPDARAQEMMKNIFQDLKLKIALQFEGAIVNTNATFREGSTVTLIEMDFARIIGNPALFKQLSAANPQSIEEMKALFKSVEGLKFETNNPVTIEFK